MLVAGIVIGSVGLVFILFGGMLKRVSITFYCDGQCGWVKMYSAHTKQDCIRLARDDGWLVQDTGKHYGNTGYGHVYCPNCRKITQR